jgi:hypothetical protein
MRPEKVLKKLAVTDKITLVLEHVKGGKNGKIRVSATPWEDARVVVDGEVLEVRALDGQLRISVKERHYDDGDPEPVPFEYNPYEADLGPMPGADA